MCPQPAGLETISTTTKFIIEGVGGGDLTNLKGPDLLAGAEDYVMKETKNDGRTGELDSEIDPIDPPSTDQMARQPFFLSQKIKVLIEIAVESGNEIEIEEKGETEVGIETAQI